MSDAIYDNYEVVKSQQTGFLSGTLPDWLNDSSVGGGSVSVESTNGGRAVLSTGTQSVDDEGKIESNQIEVYPFDAVLVQTTFKVNTDPNTAASDVCGFQSGDANNYFVHRVIDGSGADDNIVLVKNGTTDFEKTREMSNQQDRLTSQLLWDVTDDKIIHRYQDSFATQIVTSIPASDANSYITKHNIQTKDTTADRELYIYEIKIEYLRSKRV